MTVHVVMVLAGAAVIWWALTELRIIGPLSGGYTSPTEPRTTQVKP